MQSLKELYKIGSGPSSSHTLAPERACRLFEEKFGVCDNYVAELYGSLSLTGKGHFTDEVIIKSLHAPVKCCFKLNWEENFPNGFYLFGYRQEKLVAKWTIFSLGGGSIEVKEEKFNFNDEYYFENSFLEIKEVLRSKKISLWQYIVDNEDDDIEEYLLSIVEAMINSCENGLKMEGMLKGNLQVEKVAKKMYHKALDCQNEFDRQHLFMMAYAYAASEENASSHTVVTAPTLGSCGIMAAMCYYCYHHLSYSKKELAKAIAIGGIFGNLIKQNASISGATGGCQAEIGTACCMAAAAISFLYDMDLETIAYSAEIGIEHHLGLTCDPVKGYVIIPCIERNAVAILRSFDASLLARNMRQIKPNRVTFDAVVKTMNYTGKMIAHELKETSLGGLAMEVK